MDPLALTFVVLLFLAVGLLIGTIAWKLPEIRQYLRMRLRRT